MATITGPQPDPQKLSTLASDTAHPLAPVRFYDFEGFRIDVQRRRLLRNGQVVPIKRGALETLLALIEHRGRVVEKEDLMRRLWPDTAVEEANLTQNVFVVRKALGEAPGEQKFIATVARRGYQFVADVRELTAKGDTVPDRPAVDRAHALLWHGRVTAGIVVAAILGAGVALTMWQAWGTRDATDSIRAIAVLPFRNLSGDPQQEYFAEGITEAVINDLASVSALRVISHQSVVRYKGSSKALPDIAQELGADAVIEGSVSRAGGRIRLSVRLVDGRTDRQLWAASYDRAIGDVLSLQSGLSRAVADAVNVTVTEQERAVFDDRRPIDAEVYDHYLRGRYFLNRRQFRKSREAYERVITEDPRFALAYAGLAQTYAAAMGGDLMRPTETRARLRAAAEKALELDPDLIDAHVTLAATTAAHDWNWQDAERALRRILERSPNNVTAQLWYAWLLNGLGRHSEALVLHERAVAADPLSLNNNTVLGASLRHVGRYRDAIARYHRTLELDPGFAGAHRGLGWTYLAMGMQEQGMAALEEAVRLAPSNISITSSLAHAYGMAGRFADAKSILQTLEERSEHEYYSPVFLAHVHTGLGNPDAAFARLEQAFQERDPILTRIKMDHLLEPLRSDPRFRQLLQRMNLPVL